MKKLILLCFLLITCAGSYQAAAQERGVFNSLAIGINAGSTGIGFDVASPIGNYLALRAGLSFVPNISVTDNVTVHAEGQTGSMEIKGELGRTMGEVLLNVYPFKSSSFFVAGGASFGGDKLVTLSGHSDELKNLANAGIEIGNYKIPVDKDGNVSGGLQVKGFRPYLGIGFGRIVPKGRVGFMFELGAQFQGTPEVYTDNGSINDLMSEADNKFSDIIDNLKIYPVLKFRLCGRIF